MTHQHWKSTATQLGLLVAVSLLAGRRVEAQMNVRVQDPSQYPSSSTSPEKKLSNAPLFPDSSEPVIATRIMNGICTWPPVIFRNTEYGDAPNCGTPDAPSRGFSHYDYPAERYGTWYRPKSFGLKMPQRCSPGPFQPRGYGEFFNRSVSCYRMDYHPYIMQDLEGRFGPAYYRQQPDPHCPPCMLLGLGGGY